MTQIDRATAFFRLNVLASISHAQRDLPAALRDYGLVLAAQPQNLDARLARAAIYLDLKRDQEAKLDIDYLQQHFSYDPRGAYLRALYAGRRGDAAGARQALQEVTRTLSGLSREFIAASDQLKLLGGLAHHALGEYERARTYLVPYLEKHPNEAGARKLLGSIYLAEAQFERAIAILQPALRAYPDDARVMSMLGAAYMGKGNHGKAALLFQEAAATHDSPDIQTGLGISLLSAGQKEAGFNALLRAYQQAPASQTGVPLALSYLKHADSKRAVAIMGEVVKREPTNMSARNLLGVAQLAAGDVAGARASYTSAINASPGFYAAHLNLARLDEAAGQLERARQRYLGILKVAPKHRDAMLQIARLEEGAGRNAEALRWLGKAASLHSKDLRPHLALHGLYLRNGQAQQALEAARDAQALAPNHPGALLALAQGQIAVGKAELARTTLRRLTQVALFNASWLTQAAARQMQIEDYEAADYSLNKALLADAAYRPARLLQARLSMQTGNLAQAEKQALALSADTPHADSQRMLGEIRLAQQRKPEAIAAYRKAYSIDPGSDSAFGLYGALMAANQASEAAELMTAWRRRHPADYDAAHALGEAWMKLNDTAQAHALYLELVRANPTDARAHNNLANVLLQQGDAANALKYAERARTLAPNQPQVNDTLGWVLVQLRQTDKGLRYLREAALRTPEDAGIRAHLDAALLKKRQ